MPGVLQSKDISAMLGVGLGELLKFVATDRATVSILLTMAQVVKNRRKTPRPTIAPGNDKNGPLQPGSGLIWKNKLFGAR